MIPMRNEGIWIRKADNQNTETPGPKKKAERTESAHWEGESNHHEQTTVQDGKKGTREEGEGATPRRTGDVENRKLPGQ